ncbi:MAG: hypothetical protein KKH52_04145 [Nanoarchaeota archaeon]|nr:hypothetical protein [Nanoarchaeota archaeon]MBU1623313.1 hypothetical protein [Nanoarchaeota archaeon]MBU1974561.1 hypothetical protein [Nanoarchaeota archaeon]
MVKKEVLANLIDGKKAAVLRVVLNSADELYLKEIALKSEVAITSTFRILQELLEMDVLRRREWKNSKVYSCQKNEKVDFLQELFKEDFDGLQEFVKAVKELEGVQEIILQGSQGKGKANVLLIGEQIDSGSVDQVCSSLKEKGYELSYLTLTKPQYTQMSKMGLYSGEKKVLE